MIFDTIIIVVKIKKKKKSLHYLKHLWMSLIIYVWFISLKIKFNSKYDVCHIIRFMIQLFLFNKSAINNDSMNKICIKE